MTDAADRMSPDEAFRRIARRAIVLRAELRRAVEILVHGAMTDGPAGPADPDPGVVTAADLDLTADGWRVLVPSEPSARRALATLVSERFGDELVGRRRASSALGLEPDGHDTPSGTSLERALERVDLPGGASLFTQGDDADSLFVITRGRLRLLLDDGGPDSMLREIGPGETVGELALLTGDPRRGTVVAVRDSVVYRLGRADFDRCALELPTVTRHMLVTLARRLNDPPRRAGLRAVPTNIAVLPAGRDSPVAEFAAVFHRFMAEHVSTALVTERSVEDELGTGAASADPASPLGIRVHDHLSTLEEQYEHVVYLGTDDSSPWSRRCLRDADLVLLVGRAGGVAPLNRLESSLFGAGAAVATAHVHLVVVEPRGDTTPVGTSAWLRDRPVEMCHHVHLDWRSHFARLARFVVGTPVGLVLSGGAARAFAHIGVLRALRAAGIPIDVVAATSAGALIGGQFAMGWDPDLVERRNRELFDRPRRKLLDVVPPFTSIIGSTHFNAVLDEIFGDVCFEDLWIQFMCTTTDLTSATGCVHRRGRMRPFVRASCSLPMVMPPVTHDGHLLADGGIMNNVPVDPLLAVTNVGMLVVVNVTNPFYSADEAYNYDDALPLRRVLNARLNPFAEPLVAPSILDVLMRSLEIGSKSLEPAQISKADVYVRPDVSRFGYTNVADMAEIAAEGEAATAASLAELLPRSIPFADPAT